MFCIGWRFDTVDHSVLRQWVGAAGSALDWFSSYLSYRRCSVSLDSYMSETAALSWCVHQGSVLGSLLFVLYLLPLGHIINHLLLGISYHRYANCLTAIKYWIANNSLQLNTNKTEVLVVAPDSIAPEVTHGNNSLSLAVQSNLCNHGRHIWSGYIFWPAYQDKRSMVRPLNTSLTCSNHQEVT